MDLLQSTVAQIGSIDASYSNYAMQSVLHSTHRLIKPRNYPTKVVHHQSNTSYLPRCTPSLHPTKLLEQSLRFAFPPEPLESSLESKVTIPHSLWPERFVIMVLIRTSRPLLVRRRLVSLVRVVGTRRVSSSTRPPAVRDALFSWL